MFTNVNVTLQWQYIKQKKESKCHYQKFVVLPSQTKKRHIQQINRKETLKAQTKCE